MDVSARCKSCGDVVVSTRGGHWVMCKCGKSYLDRDRWFPDERFRLGGEAELINENNENKE